MAVQKKLFASKVEVVPYERTNEAANEIIEDDETWWICHGPAGRVPVMANTAVEAKSRYIEKTFEAYAKDQDI